MMTRLTDDMVKDVIVSLDNVDVMLHRLTGMNVLELAFDALGLERDSVDMDLKVSVVPVTSGLGVIRGFSESVAGIMNRLGMKASVTDGADVTGFAEAISSGSDIVFMADDVQCISYNVEAGMYSNNSFSTAAGYTTALKAAAGGLKDKEVLIIGAGRVGSIAAKMMVDMSAKVSVFDVEGEKAQNLHKKLGVNVLLDVNEAISNHILILNASPAPMDGKVIREGSIISTPGIPHVFDEEGRGKAKIIHDPLEIGVAVMAVQSASFSRGLK